MTFHGVGVIEMSALKKATFLFIFLLSIVQKYSCWSSSFTQEEENFTVMIASSKFLSQLPWEIAYPILVWLDPWEVKGMLLSSKGNKDLFNETQGIWPLWMKKWGFNAEEGSSNTASFIKGRIFCVNAFIAALQSDFFSTQIVSCEEYKEKKQNLLQKATKLGDIDALLFKKNQLLGEKQFDKAYEINEKLCKRGNQKAIEAKIEALKNQDLPLYKKILTF